nr:aquaporin [Pomacea canaliculata]
MSQALIYEPRGAVDSLHQTLAIEDPALVMEGLYVHIASKLEAIRLGQDGAKTYKVLDPKELKSVELWRAVFAEFLAQILFVFLGCGSTMFVKEDERSEAVIKIAFTFGLAIMALIQMIGHVSGGHINPAVTIAMAVTLNISIVRTVLYIAAQVTGALIGGFLLKGLIPADMTKSNFTLGATMVDKGMTAGQGVGVEIILTFVLVIVIFGTTDPNRPSFGSPSLLIGLTVTLLHLVGIKFTGCGINPSRSLGSAVASGRYKDHWVYWIGPILGGVLAAAVYKLIINPYRGAPSMEDAVQKMREYFVFSLETDLKGL